MPSARWPWWESLLSVRSRRRSRWRHRLRLEHLEDRTLLSNLAAATLLNFTPFETAQASGFLSDPYQFDLYRVNLSAGDQVHANVRAQTAGSGLASLLRVFDANGTPVAQDNQEGGDPQLTFQAATSGVYYVGVSGAPDNDYNPSAPRSGSAGMTTGMYTLNLQLTPDAPLLPDLTGGSFRLGTGTAA